MPTDHCLVHDISLTKKLKSKLMEQNNSGSETGNTSGLGDWNKTEKYEG